jgi:hypothetical protein
MDETALVAPRYALNASMVVKWLKDLRFAPDVVWYETALTVKQVASPFRIDLFCRLFCAVSKA